MKKIFYAIIALLLIASLSWAQPTNQQLVENDLKLMKGLEKAQENNLKLIRGLKKLNDEIEKLKKSGVGAVDGKLRDEDNLHAHDWTARLFQNNHLQLVFALAKERTPEKFPEKIGTYVEQVLEFPQRERSQRVLREAYKTLLSGRAAPGAATLTPITSNQAAVKPAQQKPSQPKQKLDQTKPNERESVRKSALKKQLSKADLSFLVKYKARPENFYALLADCARQNYACPSPEVLGITIEELKSGLQDGTAYDGAKLTEQEINDFLGQTYRPTRPTISK